MPLKPACVVLLYADSEDNLAIPGNPYGRIAAHNLQDLTESGIGSYFWSSGSLRLKGKATEVRIDDPWDKDLSDFKEKTVIVFLALHGGADPKGAYLLPADSNGGADEKNRLRLEKVLDRLAKIDSKKNKLLIVDATQISADWPLGILHNSFARKLDELNSKIEAIPNLIVMSASDVNQRSWVCEEWRQTVFSHFVIEGLKGAADKDQRKRINALDLHKYVQQNVEPWVRANREASQKPVLLPRGDAGEARARSMDLLVVKNAYQAPDPRTLPSFTPHADLQKAWVVFQELEKETPSPAVYAPQTWKEYQAYLLRYEQMWRADDESTARKLAGKLSELEQRLKRSRTLELTSGQNTLPMPAAAGAGLYQPDRLLNDLLGETDQANRARIWEDIQKTEKATTKSQKQLLRVQMGELLLRRVIEEQGDNLEKAANVALTLEDPANPRPAEVHFLVMLNRDRPKNSSAEYYGLVKTALKLRLTAEKTALNLPPEGHAYAYPYSERVYPWIKSLVEQGDQERRFGQDLLFATTGWAKAGPHFDEAENKYKKAQEIGQAVRDALAARDLAYEQLPAYSQWAAQRPATDDQQTQRENSELLKSIEGLWKEVHRLDRLLEKPEARWITDSPPPDTDDTQPRSIVKRTEFVNQEMRKIYSQFDGLCRKLETTANLQTDWYEVEGALVVPFMDPSRRMNLITNSRRISHTYLTETVKASAAADTGKKDEENAQNEAKRQGRMTLAVLGKPWFDTCKSGELESFNQVYSWIDTLVGASPEVLAKAEEQVGVRWQHMPVEIMTREETAAKSNLEQAQKDMQLADRLGHLMDSGAVAQLKRDPVQDYRGLMFLGLLNWQAERTFEDHWFDLDPKMPPYYQAAGSLFVDDARRLALQPAQLQALKGVQDKLAQKGRLEVDGPDRLNITSERNVGVTYRIQPPKDEVIPPGFPVAGVALGKHLQFLNPSQGDRASYDLGKEKSLAPIPVSLESPYLREAESKPPKTVPTAEVTTIKLAGLYRGQPVEKETQVYLYPLPDVVQVQAPPPQRASIAVRADPALLQHDPSNSAVMLMLDCSGSMCSPYDPAKQFLNRPQKDSRFDKAVRAIGKVLDGIEPGTNVSFWVFSDKQADGPFGRRLRDLTAWKKEQKAKLMGQIGNLHPWSETPLVRSMWQAKTDFPAHLTGFKTMIVLTDGEDSEFLKDNQLRQRGNTIPQFLTNEFKDSGIQLNLVFYEVSDPKEKQNIRDSFKCIEDKTWPTPGKMYLEKDEGKLAAFLIRALRPNLRYWVENPNDGTAPPGLGDSLEVSQKGSNDQWVPNGLAPGGYNLWAQQTARERQKILFERGDLLLLKLKKDLKFERLVFSKEDYPGKINKENDGWRMAVLQNQRVGEQGLQMLTTLERLPDPNVITLQEPKPNDVWFEIEPAGNARTPFSVRSRYQYGYPAAVWGFDVPEWPMAPPNLATPQVRVWWSPDQPAGTAHILQQVADFKSVSELNPKKDPIQVEGDKVKLESVAVEKHRVDGQQEQQICLVVRMEYAKDKPVWVKVVGDGWNAEGVEHRFYRQANKYTGIFWPVPPSGAEHIAKLSFISLEAFRREAKGRGYFLELKDAKMVPDRAERPAPKVSLK